MIEKIKISEVKPNPNNPRLIKDDKFKKLVNSVKTFPEMLELRPIIVNDDMIVLGGNMRLKACKEAGLKEVHIIKASNLSEAQQAEFVIKDNVGFGEWDWDSLANEYDENDLISWGLDLPVFEDGIEEDEDETYTSKIESPIYKCKGEKPHESELYNLEKYNLFIDEIESSEISEENKFFLKLAATRHIEFNYARVAEYYSHEEKQTQELMENSALIIIDYNKAIELGFVKLYNDLNNLSQIDE